jgi:hypothetical protein
MKDSDAIVNENYDNSLLETVPSFNSFDPLSLGESTTRFQLVSENTHRTVSFARRVHDATPSS